MTEGVKSRRLNILSIPYWYPPRKNQREVSGAFVREHVLAGAEHDDVHVLVFRMEEAGFGRTAFEMYSDEGVEVMDVTVFSGTRSPIRKIRLGLLWFCYMTRAVIRWGRPDLIHSQDMSSFYAAPMARILGVPHVVSNHWTGFMRKALTPKLIENFRRSLPGASLVLCSNVDADRDLREYGIKARTAWLPNSFDPHVFHPDPGVVKTESLVHVSGFSDQKRVPDILRAFRMVLGGRPGAFLHLVGDGRDRAEVEGLAHEILPEDSHSFHGFLPKDHVADLLRSSRGFVFPSSAETFGCALMEAMACGCPVLTTRVGGIPAVVREGEGLIVEVGDISAIAAGMIRLLDGTHDLDTEGIALGVKNRFSRSVVGELLHRHYLETCFVPGLKCLKCLHIMLP